MFITKVIFWENLFTWCTNCWKKLHCKNIFKKPSFRYICMQRKLLISYTVLKAKLSHRNLFFPRQSWLQQPTNDIGAYLIMAPGLVTILYQVHILLRYGQWSLRKLTPYGNILNNIGIAFSPYKVPRTHFLHKIYNNLAHRKTMKKLDKKQCSKIIIINSFYFEYVFFY